jgi:hypothetical protein
MFVLVEDLATSQKSQLTSVRSHEAAAAYDQLPLHSWIEVSNLYSQLQLIILVDDTTSISKITESSKRATKFKQVDLTPILYVLTCLTIST